jgi:hypothetical protein
LFIVAAGSGWFWTGGFKDLSYSCIVQNVSGVCSPVLYLVRQLIHYGGIGLENSLLSVGRIVLSNVSFWSKSRPVYSSKCLESSVCFSGGRVEIGRT